MNLNSSLPRQELQVEVAPVDGGTRSSRAMSANIDLEALAGFLSTTLEVAPRGPLSVQLIAGGRSNPTFTLTDGEGYWILRRPPFGDYVASGHDMGREATVLSALRRSDVPVPELIAYCEDSTVIGAPFYIMERLDGRTFRTQQETSTLTEDQRAGLSSAMLDTLATLHDVDPPSVGLASWGRPDGYLERQVARWGRQWNEVATTPRPQVAELMQRLQTSIPTMDRPGIVHGDFKIDNIMVDRLDPSLILGVLDWELSTLGDTQADLGLLISFWDQAGQMYNPLTRGATALPGFPTAHEVVEGYAARRGVGVDRIDWYVVFSDFKIAVILEQIHRRHLEGTTAGDGFDGIGDMVVPLLDRALHRAESSEDRSLRGRGH